jgi:hypothetical protein
MAQWRSGASLARGAPGATSHRHSPMMAGEDE